MDGQPLFPREGLIDAGVIPVGLDPWEITGPPSLIRKMEYFEQHGDLDGFVGGEDSEEDRQEDDANDAEYQGHQFTLPEPKVISGIESNANQGGAINEDTVELNIQVSKGKVVQSSDSSGTVSTDGSGARSSMISSDESGNRMPGTSIDLSNSAVKLKLEEGDSKMDKQPVPRVFPYVTSLTVEFTAPDTLVNVVGRKPQDSRSVFLKALEDQEGQSAVKVLLPIMCDIGATAAYEPDNLDTLISLPNLETAILPPLCLWEVPFNAPHLENVTIAAPDKRHVPDLAHGPPLISNASCNPAISYVLGKLKRFDTVCCSKDSLSDFEYWMRHMPELESLSVKCIHIHTKLDSRLTRQADNYFWLLLVTDAVESLALNIGRNPKLKDVYMDGILFKPGQLLAMVERRHRLRAPLRKVRVRCAKMDATECKALKQALDFEHVRTHQSGYEIRTEGCDCPCDCERGSCPGSDWQVADLDPARSSTRGCAIM